MFIDEVKINVKGGDGGNGCVSTHREIYVPRGGPDGGNGGKGGCVILVGTSAMNSLIEFKKKVHIKGKRGGHGQGNNKFGKVAPDTVVKVPLGTVIYDDATGNKIGEILRDGKKVTVARGGRGGRGNAAFATRNYRVPRFAEKGEPGVERWIRLELRLIAHVGLIGLPNAGKSTFLASTTAAKPKIADYPFTTLAPNLGVIEVSPGVRYIFADIPGLIEGAADGAGLGHRFLRHVSRTKVLLHLIDLTSVSPDYPLYNYHVIMKELENYDQNLLDRPQIVAANKIDIVGTEESFFALSKALEEKGIPCFGISAASKEGIDELLEEMFNLLKTIDINDFTLLGDEPEEDEDYVVIDETTENLSQFTIEKVEDYFVVHGEAPERMVKMMDLDNDEAVHHLQMRLNRMGVEKALLKNGAENGNFVVIGDYEFKFYHDDIPDLEEIW